MDSTLALLQQLLELAGKLLLLTLAGLLLWLAISPIAYALLRVAETLRLPDAWRWLLVALRAINPLKAWKAAYSAIPTIPAAGAEAKVILDERHASLREAIRRSLGAIKSSESTLMALGGAKGPGAVAKDILSIQDRVEGLADLGGEIPESIASDYQRRTSVLAKLFFSVFFLTAIAIANGALLNQFFKDLIPGRLAGMRLSYVVSVVVICVEAALGNLVYVNRNKPAPKILYIALVAVAALMEAVIFGFMSYGFDFDVPYLDDYPSLRFWMAPFGFILVASTAGMGFEIHQASDELSEVGGAKRLKREIRTLNSLIRDLPEKWDAIRAKAEMASASIANFQSALGGRQGALAGAVEKIAVERSAMEKSLVDARLDSWPDAVGGLPADSLKKSMQQLALGLFTLVAAVVFAIALEGLLGRAFRSWDTSILAALSVLGAAAFYIVGWLSFDRIQIMAERVYPLRSGTPQTVVVAIAGGAALIAILTAGWRVGGTSGFAYGLVIAAGGGVLAVLGYYFDDSIKGLTIAGRMIAAIVLGIAAMLVAAAAHLVGWPFLGVLGAIWLLLGVLAWPLERLIIPRFARSAPIEPKRRARPSKAASAA